MEYVVNFWKSFSIIITCIIILDFAALVKNERSSCLNNGGYFRTAYYIKNGYFTFYFMLMSLEIYCFWHNIISWNFAGLFISVFRWSLFSGDAETGLWKRQLLTLIGVLYLKHCDQCHINLKVSWSWKSLQCSHLFMH